MIKPGAAVKDGNLPHPIWMIVDDQKIYRPALAAQQSEADMVKIAGAKKGRVRLVIDRTTQSSRKGSLKSVKSSKAATQAYAPSPMLQLVNGGPVQLYQLTLTWNAAVQINHSNAHN